VRHLESVELRALETPHPTAEESETGDGAELLALLEEELQAETDAEERRAAEHDLAHRLDETAVAEVLHAGTERADAGQHDAIGGKDPSSVARHLDGSPRARETLLDAAEVAHPVVDDGDHGVARTWLTTTISRSGTDMTRAE
jgi:hypothetical protein